MRLFLRRRSKPDSAAAVAARARELAAAAERVSAQAAWLAQRERGLDERELKLDDRMRDGAQELDERRDALARLGQQLGEREDRLADLESRAADIDAREQELRDREARLLTDGLAARRRADEVRAGEERLARQADELHAREAHVLAEELGLRRLLDELEHRPSPQGVDSPAGPAAPVREAAGCVLFVPSPGGYRLVPLELAPPRPGERVELEGAAFDVLRLGPSPLPEDDRPCAFLAA